MEQMSCEIKLKKEKEVKKTKAVFIDSDLNDELLELKQETGMPVQKLVDTLLREALDFVVVEE